MLVPLDYPFGSPRTARPRLMPPGVAGVCHARGRPMTPPNSIKMIALITLLIGVALLLAALLY